MSLTKKQRADLFAMFGGRCAYCGCLLSPKRWHADHVEPIVRWRRPSHDRYEIEGEEIVKVRVKAEMGMHSPENDRSDNFLPSCLTCNVDKGAMSLEGWREWIGDKPRVLRDNYSAFRHAERFGLVQIIAKPVVFYFEQAGAQL